MGTHFCGNIFTAFNFTYEMHWCACCDFETALQTTSLHSASSSSAYKWPVYKGLPKSTTCPSSNYTHCSQLLLIHRMVAYSNHSPVENKMATRAMPIRDAFMLPLEPLTVVPHMDRAKKTDSSHHQSKLSCLHVVYQCVPYIDEWPNSVKSMKMSDLPPHI